MRDKKRSIRAEPEGSYFYIKLRRRNTGERKNNERKSHQSNFYSNLCTDQLHSWSVNRAGPPDGGLQCP